MTLTAVVAPLAAYAALFQTAVYLSLPTRLRMLWAPVVTGGVGALLTVSAGILFGFDEVGLVAFDPASAVSWGLAAVVVASLAGGIMISRPSLRTELADPRLVSLSRRQMAGQVFVRIPLFTALIEEAFFRGVLHAALAAIYPSQIALWLGAGLFGLWHIGPGMDQAEAADKSRAARARHTVATVLATTLAGAFLVWLRIETGSIWAPFAVHAGINMTMAAFARLACRWDRHRPSWAGDPKSG